MGKKICIIGNNALGKEVRDGGRIKIRLYANKLSQEGADVSIIDLDGWKRRIISTLWKVKKAIKTRDEIVIMAGPRGCRMILPIVIKWNKKHHKRIVFCPLGIGTLDAVVEKLSVEDREKFMSGDFLGLTDSEMGENLKKLDCAVLQNREIERTYRGFYNLVNTCVLGNFREDKPIKNFTRGNDLRLVYVSRVTASKGIFDLLEATKSLIDEGTDLRLDIYGDLQFADDEKRRFDSFEGERIHYKGTLHREEVVKTINQYDLFCFPTKYHGEGTPGALVESFFAGTPCLISSYGQSRLFVTEGENGFIFQIGDVADLKRRLKEISSDKEKLYDMREKSLKKAEEFTYEYNRDQFLKIFVNYEDTHR